jgi:hypothetical protein
MNTLPLIRHSLALRRATLLGIIGITAGLGGCAVYPAGYGYGYASETVVTRPVVRYEAPPPRVTVVGVAPFAGAIWAPRHRGWRDGLYSHRGYWAHPRAGWGHGGRHRDNDGWHRRDGR